MMLDASRSRTACGAPVFHPYLDWAYDGFRSSPLQPLRAALNGRKRANGNETTLQKGIATTKFLWPHFG